MRSYFDDILAVPKFNRQVVVVSDDPLLAAELSSLFGDQGEYLSVLIGPRMGRLDWQNEVVRRINAVGRVQTKVLVLAKLSQEVRDVIAQQNAPWITVTIDNRAEIQEKLAPYMLRPLSGDLRCRTIDVGIGLLLAKRRNSRLIIDDRAAPIEISEMTRGHVVAIDDPDPMAQIIAANYAYAIDADLIPIPKRDDDIRKLVYHALEERFARRDMGRCRGAETAIGDLRTTISPTLKFGSAQFVTFVTRGIPYGYFLPSTPSTHLFSYPELGESINRCIDSATRDPMTLIAVLVDPGHFAESETAFISSRLRQGQAATFTLRNNAASVELTSMHLESLPHDLFFICSHCGEVSGELLTLRFCDSAGESHVVQVEEAIGVGSVSFNPDMNNHVHIHQLIHPVTIDGEDWFAGREEARKFIREFWEYALKTPREKWEITDRTELQHVTHSTAIQLYDHNLILTLVQRMEATRAPIIFNNSCVSFFDAAKSLMFAGARSYLGTLANIDTEKAQEFAESIFGGRMKELSLPYAAWLHQRRIYPNPDDRPYVHMGCHFNSIRLPHTPMGQLVIDRIRRVKESWETYRAKPDAVNLEAVEAIIRFLNAVLLKAGAVA